MDKWKVYMEIQQLHKQGFKVANIARNLGISRTTVYKYLQRSPEEMAVWMAGTKTRKRKLDAYRDIQLNIIFWCYPQKRSIPVIKEI